MSEMSETDTMRVILAWLDKCPMAYEISSMQGSILHIKVSREQTKEHDLVMRMGNSGVRGVQS